MAQFDLRRADVLGTQLAQVQARTAEKQRALKAVAAQLAVLQEQVIGFAFDFSTVATTFTTTIRPAPPPPSPPPIPTPTHPHPHPSPLPPMPAGTLPEQEEKQLVQLASSSADAQREATLRTELEGSEEALVGLREQMRGRNAKLRTTQELLDEREAEVYELEEQV